MQCWTQRKQIQAINKVTAEDKVEDAMEIMKKAAEIADEMIGTVGWLINRVSNTSKLYDISDAKGLTAEVTVPIQAGRPGEVVVLLGHSLRNFQARATSESGNFTKGSQVLVVDAGPNILYVRVHGEADSSTTNS